MSKERILIIDDSKEVVNHLAADVLPTYGYEVLYAFDGEQGLELIKKEKPDLVLLDHHLPKMTGLDIMQRMVQESIPIPVILMTGYGSELSAVQAFRLGAKDYLVKPFTIDEIVNMIDRALVESRLQQDNDRLTDEVRRLKGEMSRQSNEMQTLFEIGKAITSFLTFEQVIKRVLTAAQELTQGNQSHIWLPDDDQDSLKLQGSVKNSADWLIKINESSLGEVFLSERPFRQTSYDNNKIAITKSYAVQAILAVPLRLGNHTIGVISVSSSDAPITFSQREEFLLFFLADYAAIAFENARIFEQTDSALTARVEELNTLLDITQTITSSLDIQDILTHTINHVHKSWNIEASSIWWLNPKQNSLRVLANVGTATDSLDQIEVTVGQGIVGKVVETGEKLLINDVKQSPDHLQQVDQKTGFVTRDILCVPLRVQGNVVGAMQLLNKKGQPFDSEDLERAELLASAVAIAVMNAKTLHQSLS